ncbi:MAG: tRNA (adenosine(37)-N6)-threonylcarbamoyltransferase complex transferase subunit TsaD [Candidatus Omnitrophica bacterium]|nr:tRNA (adenosine(37)-N6)-threonylcarbamoyltransferase complex transferase subunit TsaD [Candidatus Omnitrophota bacterium]
MNVLGIETSCDETGIAIVKDGRNILGEELSSSLKYHQSYGGIIPEIASRMHLEVIDYLLKKLLKKTRLTNTDIDLVAVTNGPGLTGSLLVGVSFAKALAFALGVPLIGVDHLSAHLYAAFLESRNKKIAFPFVGLVVSGGHTSLFYVKDFLRIEILGSTLDDACGELFDKVARFLNLGYPGGPVIEKLASRGNPIRIHFSPIRTKRPLDFSFSGIKTSVFYHLKDKGIKIKEKRGFLIADCPLSLKQDLCASLQEIVFNSLVKKSLLACRIKNIDRLIIGGGVAMNEELRRKFLSLSVKEKVEIYFSPKKLCMDNASMVAGLGYVLFKAGKSNDFNLEIHAD